MRIAACALLALVSGSSFATEVYRSTDANGTVVYSDRPVDPKAEYVLVATPRSAAARKSAAPRPPPAQASAPAQTGARAAAAQSADERAKLCTTARERLQRYTISRRLYRTLENGEREYLTDAEIDDARARAAADVENWCE